MSNITFQFPIEMLLPTLQVYKDYFNRKYPCTTEENGGDNMPIEDEIKFMVYDYILTIHVKNEDVSIEEYDKLITKAS